MSLYFNAAVKKVEQLSPASDDKGFPTINVSYDMGDG
jgi:hypothetical protein